MVGVFRAPAEEDGRGGLTPNRSRSVVPPHLSIADVMEGNLATVLPESSIRSAVRLMIENRISSVPVVDADGAIVGALNEGDLMKVFYEPDTRCVADVMTRDPIVVSVDANLVEVIDALMSSNFRRVLIRENDLLVGVITRSHVMPALLEALEKGT
jgi:CBS domain-containing protein